MQRRPISPPTDQGAAKRGLIDVLLVRFLLVGCLNILVGYGLFAIFIFLGMHSAFALLISTVLGVLFNYFSTGRLVFAWRSAGRLWLFVLGYAVLYGLNAAALAGLERASFSPLLAQALLLPPIVGLAFLYNKHFVFIRTEASPP